MPGVLIFCFGLSAALASTPAAPPASSPTPAEAFTNRLIHEKSPYLLQHAHNPVDWFPWGPEAFERAKKENKPIFLSIGYSTCHWCHVMEKESFENVATAKFLNDHFVSIKVDREQRPDLDSVYMTFVQATTGSGGWPMTVWLTPDRKPIVGGTYFPSREGQGLPTLMTMLTRVHEAWRDHQAEVEKQAADVTSKLRDFANQPSAGAGPLSADLLQKEFDALTATFDAKQGGFGPAPKFPRPVALQFLLDFAAREGTTSPPGKAALSMVLFTLHKMAAGGIHDQLGGGFHRYATDGIWLVPHFEKMLYDQAQLASVYTAAYQITHDESLLAVARDILDYVKRDMTEPDGGFDSAEDADSLPSLSATERSEGSFYLWTSDQIHAVLGPAESPLFDFVYGIAPDGNVPVGHGKELEKANILFQKHTAAEAAAHFHLSESDVASRLRSAGQQLLTARAQRPRPRKDDKILTAWNGLMISAFARAYQAAGDPADLAAAQHAARFLETHLYDSKTHLLQRAFAHGSLPTAAFASDYAMLIQGLLDLYQASLDTHWIEWALDLQASQDRLFWDSVNGGYFNVSSDDPTVLIRTREIEDQAEPSANSVAALNLLRLSRLLDDAALQERAGKIFRAFSSPLAASPGASPQMLGALAHSLSPSQQVVIVGKFDDPATQAMLTAAQRPFAPYRTLVWVDGSGDSKFFAQHAPFYNSLVSLHGKATAYVCRHYACQAPTTDLQAMIDSMNR
ncbi:thioredoxin domain-containing protein [soil metagenome]